MIASTKPSSFPQRILQSPSGGLPIEVCLIHQLGFGTGDQLITAAQQRQQSHTQFLSELDEPSARLGDSHFELGDHSSLYTFSVGAQGHPFHCHAGNRMFTAISGASGTQLRFSMATPEQLAVNPHSFFDTLHVVNIPADCLFTVRFGGGTWHQFAPLLEQGTHPTMFAISCHADELGGIHDADLRQQILNGKASIPSLTRLLPATVTALLEGYSWRDMNGVSTSLMLNSSTIEHAEIDLKPALDQTVSLQDARVGLKHTNSHRVPHLIHSALPQESLLRQEFNGEVCDYCDFFVLELSKSNCMVGNDANAKDILGRLLQSFVDHRHQGVSKLMRLRNLLAAPFGLRTSPLACPVSSL
ncbi:MAG: DUF2867 domain-containing protein, partial [Undibacterium sp.]|nr:DUF2867 domain-containing protein [Undibacterium sp.]